MRRLNLPIGALLVVALAGPAAASPVEDVLRLVPPDTAVCLVVRDLRGHAEQVLDSPFADWFRRSEFGRAVLSSDGMTKLAEAETAITTHLGVTTADLRNDIFGDAVVLAYQPPRDAAGQDESGVVLLKARNVDTLTALLRKLDAAQTGSGEVKAVREKRHAGLAYFEREKAEGRTEYYAVRADGVFAYSAQERAIRQVLERCDSPPGQGAEPEFVRLRNSLKSDAAVVQVVFNPRSLDRELGAKVRGVADAHEKAFLTQFEKVWAATEAIGIGLTLDRSAELSLTLAFHADRLPAEWKSLVAPDTGSSALWAVIPPDALFATAGRVDRMRAIEFVRSFLHESAVAGWQKMTDETIAPIVGRKELPNLLAGLGPDWGFWVTRPSPETPSVLPVATFALRVRATGGTDGSVGDALISGLDTVAHLFRVAYNRDHDDQFSLTEHRTDAGTVKALTNPAALPEGVSPAYGLRGDFLVIASHPTGVSGFAPPTAAENPKPAPLVRMSVATLIDYLKTHEAALADAIAGWTGEKPADVAKGLRDFCTVMEFCRTLELSASGDGTRFQFTLRLETKQPLQK